MADHRDCILLEKIMKTSSSSSLHVPTGVLHYLKVISFLVFLILIFKTVVTVGKHIPQGDTGRGEKDGIIREEI